MTRLTRLALVAVAALSFASSATAASPPPPLPDNPVTGKPEKPTVGLWLHTRIKGHKGLWWCYIPPNHRANTPLRCWRTKP